MKPRPYPLSSGAKPRGLQSTELLMKPRPYPLSSRAEPRDLRFNGPLLAKFSNLSEQGLLMKPRPYPLSSRAKPRDLQFYGPLLAKFSNPPGRAGNPGGTRQPQGALLRDVGTQPGEPSRQFMGLRLIAGLQQRSQECSNRRKAEPCRLRYSVSQWRLGFRGSFCNSGLH
jgi:hypothetical protein